MSSSQSAFIYLWLENKGRLAYSICGCTCACGWQV